MKAKNTPPSEVKAITREINKLADHNFTVNQTEEDFSTAEKIKVTWEDLLALKDELSSQVINLVYNVTSIVENKQILDTIVNKANFSKLVEVFFGDVGEYSTRVKNLRAKHESRTGKIMSVQEFEEYNKLAVEYYSLSEELIHVLAPTVTEIIIMSNADVAAKIKTMETEDVGTTE